MLKHHRFWSRSAACLLAVMMLLQPLCALAQEQEEPITHTAKATVALKVRRAPDKGAGGNDSIERGEQVNILEYGNEWCRVRASRNIGYVMTKYLTDIVPVSDVVAKAEEPEEIPDVPVGNIMPGFTTNESNFHEGYYAYAVTNANIYEEPREDSRCITTVPTYKEVIVSEVSGDWCLARYQGRIYGYMKCASLFKWDRIDPYVGEIPGLHVWPYMAFVNHTTDIYELGTNQKLKTINPGAAICVGEKDELGRYPTLYHRTMGYVMEDEIAWLMPVVDWQEAKSGDLISVMTTYFAVGVSTLQYQGRNWNIRLAGTFISGTVLQPGEEYNQNQVIGPYRKSTGYKEAPIMSDEALSGYGGGTCQLNTTFYNTTIQLPLLVKHRKVHANVGMEYALKGFDAAVGAGDINLIMENTMPYPIRYQCFISDGVLTVCIFKE